MGAHNPAHRRYVMRVAGFMIAYLLTLLLAKWMVKRDLADGALLWALAMLPTLPIIGVFWAVGRLLVEESDEYLRARLVRQCLFATAFTLVIATMWGFLENFGLVEHVDAYVTAFLWFVGLGLAALADHLTRPRLEE